jgi:RNA polymerase-interacting CarD/CdnL/TRCF family regulator
VIEFFSRHSIQMAAFSFCSTLEERFEMGYQIGDKVIHWTYGLGEIVKIEEKTVRNNLTNCYVVRTSDLTIWIPIDDEQQHSLRVPTPPEKFSELFAILTGPSEKLQEDRMLRRSQLMDQLKDGQLASICRVVRDLTHFQRGAKLNDQERSILERAMHSLLTEWTYSLGTPSSQAHQAVTNMLGG